MQQANEVYDYVPQQALSASQSLHRRPCTPFALQTDIKKRSNRTIQHFRGLKFVIVTLSLLAIRISLAFTPSIITQHRTNNARSTMPHFGAATLEAGSSFEMSSFANRMKNIIKKDAQKADEMKAQKAGLPTNVVRLSTLSDFKKVVVDENKDKIVVVRWYAPWCKACKAVAPAFYRLASMYPNVVFADVPVTPDNVNLHQGLEVPSLPYSHIYHPMGKKLVEELKISKRFFPAFARTLKTYVDGACSIEYEENDIIITPKSVLVYQEDSPERESELE